MISYKNGHTLDYDHKRKGKEIKLTGLNVSTSNLSRCTKVDTHEFTLG